MKKVLDGWTVKIVDPTGWNITHHLQSPDGMDDIYVLRDGSAFHFEGTAQVWETSNPLLRVRQKQGVMKGE